MKCILHALTTLLLALPAVLHGADAPRKLNFLFITADDMNYDSAGCYGCPVKDLTPNLDRLAVEGIRFHYAYSTVAVCQPVREIMHTGLYPHRNGAMGFFPLRPHVRTLNQQLHDAGYLISMIGKNPHHQPAEKFCVDYVQTRISRWPAQLATATHEFLTLARQQGRPFFHHVNCTDPHRPFIGAGGPDDLAGGEAPSRYVRPAEVSNVPGFLEDLPEVRREVATYYTSVRRLDDCVGALLQALKDEGAVENTLVMFYGGDHGMSFPFAKSNDYENSSRGALILRWPGVIQPGGVDREHLVSTLDFTPTLLDAAGLPPPPGIDGPSFLPAIKGAKMSGWDRVFTFYNANSANQWFPMRCVRTKDRSYIWNAWSDGQTQYRAENMNGLTWKAMLAAARQKLIDEHQRPPRAKAKAKAKRAAAKAASTAPKVVAGKDLIAFVLPQAVLAAEPVTVGIRHQFPEDAGQQLITVTMLAAADNQRLDRKVVQAQGAGEIEVTFTVPAEQTGQSIKFAAFVGENFVGTPQHIHSAPLAVDVREAQLQQHGADVAVLEFHGRLRSAG